MSKILLHICCAPCATYVNKWLSEKGFDVRDFFYNPNLRPRIEYERRLLTAKHYGMMAGYKVICEEQDQETAVGDCENCYGVRLRRTAELAKTLLLDCFSTTLLISPYQKHDLLKRMGQKIGQEAGIEFYYQDFRVGYRESRQMAKEMKLYRQKYCGCGAETITKEEEVYAKAG